MSRYRALSMQKNTCHMGMLPPSDAVQTFITVSRRFQKLIILHLQLIPYAKIQD